MLTIHKNFKEFDEFNEFVAAWDIDIRQVERGCLNASLNQIVLDSSLLTKAKFDKTALQRGAAAPGMWTFAFLDSAAPEVEWCGSIFSPGTVAIFPKGNEFCGVSPPGFHVYTVSFTERELIAAALRLGLPSICKNLDEHGEIRQIDHRRIVGICRLVNKTLNDVPAEHTKASWVETKQKSAHEGIAEQLVIALSVTDYTSRPPSARRLTSARNLTLEYIEEHLAEGIRIPDLLKTTGVSRRTLEYAFRDQIGISPKQFINTQRLIRVRRELQRNSFGSPVSDIANRWGFWHMGQFAADYRRQFGELPSVTTGRQR